VRRRCVIRPLSGCGALHITENAPSPREHTPHGAFSARWCVLGAS
jgi:hypothetical protein